MQSKAIPENDPNLKSFIEVDKDDHFPIQNLPFGIFKPTTQVKPRAGIAIGNYVLDLSALEEQQFFNKPPLKNHRVFNQATLNAFMALGRDAWRAARSTVSHLLRHDVATLRDNESLRAKILYPRDQVTMCLPVKISGYTDFYSSKEHATNLGIMFRGKENPLMPNWLHMPIGYDGRASSIVVSGTDFHRPCGQVIKPNQDNPIFSASNRLDTEVEVGFVIGCDSQQGSRISTTEADDYVFGLVLLSDWSARDIQKWEYQPLGPFLGKNFCTTISPWIVTLDALKPFQLQGPQQTPKPLSYLQCDDACNFDLHLEMHLQTAKMKQPDCVSQGSFKDIYWNYRQQLAHHTVNGCNMKAGDIFASGTVSGKETGSYGSFIELTWNGKNPLQLSSGEERTFLEDSDKVIMTGWCQGQGYRVGFGALEGTVLPAKE